MQDEDVEMEHPPPSEPTALPDAGGDGDEGDVQAEEDPGDQADGEEAEGEGEGEDEEEEDSGEEDEEEDEEGDSEGSVGVDVEEPKTKDDGNVVKIEADTPIAIPVLLNQHSLLPTAPTSLPTSSTPDSNSITPSTAKPSAKPKSKAKPPKPERSPSPPALLRPPPIQTIRLRIMLGGPDNYEVDIAKLEKETGQRPPSPVLKLVSGGGDSSGSEGEDEGGKKSKAKEEPAAAEGTEGKPKKKKKKAAASDYYDVSDPFIDDSELALDDRKYFAQTKQAGFYVSSGEVALLKDRSPVKKPKSKKAPLTIHTHAPPPSQTLVANPDAGPSSLVNVMNASNSYPQSSQPYSHPPHSQSYTYPPPSPPSHQRPPGPSSSRPPNSSSTPQPSASAPRPPHSRSSPSISTSSKPKPDQSEELGTKDSPIALYSDGESDSSSLCTALKSPGSGSKKRTVLVQGKRAEGMYPGSGPEWTQGYNNSASNANSAGGQGVNQSQGHGRKASPIYWRFSLENPLLGLGKERVKQGVQADPVSIRKLAWGDRPEMSFVFDDGEGGNSTSNGMGEDGEGGNNHHQHKDDGTVVVGGGADKRKRYTTVVENGKKRKIVDITSFHPSLHPLFTQLKAAIAAESWEVKGRFPPSIKPILANVALTAIKLDEYDDHIFNLMPTLFMYNKFTMSKLIKRTVFTEHTAMIVERQDALLTQLKKEADEGFQKAEEEWERSVVAWDKRQKKVKPNVALSLGPGTPGPGGSGAESASNAPTRHPSPSEDVPMPDHDDEEGDNKEGKDGQKEGAAGKDGKKVEQPPAKKYRMMESMKAIVWELVLLSNECCRLENEKNSLEGSVMQVSEQGLRKVLYQKIVSCFPAGWMNSGQISRDVSAMKKKLEKELEEEEE